MNFNRTAGVADTQGCFSEFAKTIRGCRIIDPLKPKKGLKTKQKATRCRAVSCLSPAFSSLTFSDCTGMFSSKYDQLLMGETNMREAVRVHFLHRSMTRETLFGKEMPKCVCVCVCGHAYIYIVLNVRVKEWKNKAREREMQSCYNLSRVKM